MRLFLLFIFLGGSSNVLAFGRRRTLLCFAKNSGFAPSGGGFGLKQKKKGGGIVSLSPKAKKLLKKHGNNVDAASTEYFQSLMRGIHSSKEEEAPNENKADTKADSMHVQRVAATWDTVGLFLPLDYSRTKGKVEAYVERRLKHIVTACGKPKTLLDVGCGDGALINYLSNTNKKNDAIKYVGIDVSSEMIDLAQRQHPKHSFQVGSFPQDIQAGENFDTILFNGSLQFFRDTRQVLFEARQRLNEHGRIVLSHVNGAKFVREECHTSQGVAVRNMPNTVSLQSMAEMLGMRVLEKADLIASDAAEWDAKMDGDDDQFYLVALEMP